MTTAPQSLRLRLYPDPVLRTRASEVVSIDDDLRARVKRMFEIMYQHRGIGLAAPQVGVSERVFVVNLTGDRLQPGEELVFINPEIRDPRGECVEEEGCLSFPDVRLDVARPELVRIEATDLEGDRFSIDADGWLARCVQHELDHLDGVLFVARVPMQSRLSIRERLQDLERAYGES